MLIYDLKYILPWEFSKNEYCAYEVYSPVVDFYTQLLHSGMTFSCLHKILWTSG